MAPGAVFPRIEGSSGRRVAATVHSEISVRWPVSRVLSTAEADKWPFLWDAHCCAPRATHPDGDPETDHLPSLLVLLPVGLAMPPLLPEARCALTAPFQPCRRSRGLAVFFLWRCPAGCPGRTLSVTVFPWSPDFPPAALASGQRPSGHLTPGNITAFGARGNPAIAAFEQIHLRFANPLLKDVFLAATARRVALSPTVTRRECRIWAAMQARSFTSSRVRTAVR